jgi:hypothetical protein
MLTAFAGKLFSSLRSLDGHAIEIWVTDGTTNGTARAVRIPAAPDAYIRYLQPTPAGIYFAIEAGSDSSLWRSDGSQAGTWQVLASNGGPRDPWWGTSVWFRDRLLFIGSTLEDGVQLFETFGTPDTTSPIKSFGGSSYGNLTRVGDRVYFVPYEVELGYEIWRIDAATALGCPGGDEVLCTAEGRFHWLVGWRDFEGNQGLARRIPLAGDSGLFWFFDSSHIELAVKALDGSGVNGHTWVFLGSLSNVAFSTTVVDVATESGKSYRNPAGVYASRGDIEALPAETPEFASPAVCAEESPAIRSAELAGSGACVPTETRLCLFGGRIAVEATWEDFVGGTGVGRTIPLTSDTGAFWFFAPSNLEILFKVFDGRPMNGHLWVYYGALSNVEYRLTVTDTTTGESRVYFNPAGRFASAADNWAF